ncbi:MAG: hypothetical protein AABY83_14555 [Pseudomonadota bacterium]
MEKLQCIGWILIFGLSACGTAARDVSQVDYYSVGGQVKDLRGPGLVLLINDGDRLDIADNGAFTFRSKIANGSDYNVVAVAHPQTPLQRCEVHQGQGRVLNADINNILVECLDGAVRIKGRVRHLETTGMILQNNGGDDLRVDEVGSIEFAAPLQYGKPYRVTIKTQPVPPVVAEGATALPAQRCGVAHGRGVVGYDDIADIVVSCESTRTAQVNAGTQAEASYSAPQVVYNASGDGLAVWEADLGDVRRLMASFYRKTDTSAMSNTWQPETLIAEAPTNGAWSFMTELQLAAGIANYAVAWKTAEAQIAALAYQGGAWELTSTSLSSGNTIGHYAIASNGANVMAVWQQDTQLNARVYAQDSVTQTWSWLAQSTAATLNFSAAEGTPKYITPALVGNATQFRVAWNITEDVVNELNQSLTRKAVKHVNYNLQNRSWDTNSTLLARVNNDIAPQIAVNDVDFAVAYQVTPSDPDTNPYIMMNLGSVSARNQGCKYDVTIPIADLQLLAAATDFSLGWNDKNGNIVLMRCVLKKVKGDMITESTVSTIDATYRPHTLTATTDGTDHVYAWLQDVADGGVSVQTATYGTPSTGAIPWPIKSLATAPSPTVTLVGHGEDIELLSHTWNADKKTYLPQLSTYTSAATSTPATWNAQSLAQTSQSMQPQHLDIAANDYQERLALWAQPTLNQTSGAIDTHTLYARIEAAGAWQAPVVIPAARDDALIVTDGGDLIVVWLARDANPGLWAQRYDRVGAKWLDAAKALDLAFADVPNAEDLVLARGDRGALLAWRQMKMNNTQDVVAVVYRDGAWTAPRVIDTGVEPVLAAASDGVGFALAWAKKSTEGRRQVLMQRHDGQTWDTPRAIGDIDPAIINANHTAITAQLALASNGDNYTATWLQENIDNDNISVISVATRRFDATANNYQIVILDTQAAFSQLRIAATHTGYTVAWVAANALRARRSTSNDGTQWSDPTTLATLTTDTAYDLRSDGDGYLAAWRQDGKLLGTQMRGTDAWTTAAEISNGLHVTASAIDAHAQRAHAAWIARGVTTAAQGGWAKTGF